MCGRYDLSDSPAAMGAILPVFKAAITWSGFWAASSERFGARSIGGAWQDLQRCPNNSSPWTFI